MGPWPPNELPVDADVGTNTGAADEAFEATPADTPRPDEESDLVDESVADDPAALVESSSDSVSIQICRQLATLTPFLQHHDV